MEKKIYNSVWGHDRGTNSSRPILSEDGSQRLAVDHSRPVTLDRAREILRKGESISGRTLEGITIEYSEFEEKPDHANRDSDNPWRLLKKKVWRYNIDKNELTIFEDGEPVWNNENGVVTRDAVAIADNMGI